MVRKTYTTLVAMAVAALVMVGCGKEDVSDLTSTWTAKEGDVQTKLQSVMAKHSEFQNKFTALPAGNPSDTTMAADRMMVDKMLQDHQAKVTEIEAKLKEHQAKRDELVAAGNRTEIEAAWKSAEADYEANLTTLNELEAQHSDISSRLDKLNKPAASATGIDTVVVDPAKMKTDTAAAHDAAKTDAKKDATHKDSAK